MTAIDLVSSQIFHLSSQSNMVIQNSNLHSTVCTDIKDVNNGLTYTPDGKPHIKKCVRGPGVSAILDMDEKHGRTPGRLKLLAVVVSPTAGGFP